MKECLTDPKNSLIVVKTGYYNNYKGRQKRKKEKITHPSFVGNDRGACVVSVGTERKTGSHLTTLVTSCQEGPSHKRVSGGF